MKKPFLIRIAPASLRARLFHRFYKKQACTRSDLFEAAPLHFAPNVKMRLQPTDTSHGYIAFAGYHELDLTRRMVAHSKTGGLLVDVGANYGYYSLLWAAARQANRAIAFEASSRAFSGLQENIGLNNFGSQIAAHPLAVGRSPGRLCFEIGPIDQTSWGGITLQNSASAVEVDVTTLDAYFAGDEIIHVLKIDVEGADTWVLQGAERLLAHAQIKQIYFEQNKVRMKDLGIRAEDALEFLNALDYVVKPIGNPASHLVEYSAHPQQ